MTLKERIKAALDQDPSIIITRDEIETTKGFPVAYFEMLGLTKTDLKKLDRMGLALRGYLHRRNAYGKNAGFESRYALLADRRIENEFSERGPSGDGSDVGVRGSAAGSDSSAL